MRKMSALLVLVILGAFLSCSRTGNNDETDGPEPGKTETEGGIKTETIAGVTHVYNPSTPLKGIVTLELERVREIDSQAVDAGKPVFFTRYDRSPDGRVYLCDSRDFTIYSFDNAGKLVNRFLKKGEGPGEFANWYEFSVQAVDTDVWVPGRQKIARFSTDGKFLEEFKFQRNYRRIEMVDANRFVGNYFVYNEEETDERKKRKSVCGLLDKQENVGAVYLEDFRAGGILVSGKSESGGDFTFNVALPAISPSILHRVSPGGEKVYLCISGDYTIYIKRLTGEPIRVVHREHLNKALSEDDRNEIVDEIFYRQPPHIKKIIRDNLPGRFCAVFNLFLLPKGYFALNRITGPREFRVDIFDPTGRYIYEVELPESISSRGFLFFNNILSVNESIDDRDVYREYRVKNLPRIFGD